MNSSRPPASRRWRAGATGRCWPPSVAHRGRRCHGVGAAHRLDVQRIASPFPCGPAGILCSSRVAVKSRSGFACLPASAAATLTSKSPGVGQSGLLRMARRAGRLTNARRCLGRAGRRQRPRTRSLRRSGRPAQRDRRRYVTASPSACCATRPREDGPAERSVKREPLGPGTLVEQCPNFAGKPYRPRPRPSRPEESLPPRAAGLDDKPAGRKPPLVAVRSHAHRAEIHFGNLAQRPRGRSAEKASPRAAPRHELHTPGVGVGDSTRDFRRPRLLDLTVFPAVEAAEELSRDVRTCLGRELECVSQDAPSTGAHSEILALSCRRKRPVRRFRSNGDRTDWLPRRPVMHPVRDEPPRPPARGR